MTYEEEYKRLNSEQKRAVDTTEGPVLVIAGPGTGKTQLLSLRVVNILRTAPGANPGNILCLTYTESGQSAMQKRLTELVGELAKQIHVLTFHSFGKYLIDNYNEYFSEYESFSPADDLKLYEVLLGCFENIGHTDPLSRRAFGEYIYLADAQKRISHFKQAGLTPQQTLKMAETDLAWSKTHGRKIADAFTSIDRLSIKKVAPLGQQLTEVLNQTHPGDSLAAACTSSLSTAIDESVESGKTAPLSAWKKTWLYNEDSKKYLKAQDQLEKLKSLANIYDNYVRTMHEQKLYDYDDMILSTLKALETNKNFKAELQETFHYILADEYQDTNPAQAKIIEHIADNPVNEGRPNVMVVGDDDQAIYGFQGALGNIMLAFRERWRDVTVITLRQNYRSTQTILDTAREVILRGEQRLENYYEDIDKKLTSQHKEPGANPERLLHNSKEAVHETIEEIARNTPLGEELAIIARKHKHLRDLAAHLDKNNVDYYYEGRDDILGDEQVQFLLLLAEICLSIQSEHFNRLDFMLPELLTNPRFAITKQSAWQLAIDSQKSDYTWWQALNETSDPGLTKLRKLLTKLSDGLNSKDALAALHYLDKGFTAEDPATQKLEALSGHVTTYLQRETSTLPELLRYVKLCKQAGLRLDLKAASGEQQAQVRLMTAHRSKGLEFANVIVLHADEYTWFKEKGRTNSIGLPTNWQHLQPAKEGFDDLLRLIYVVLTRGKTSVKLLAGSGNTKTLSHIPGTENLREQVLDTENRLSEPILTVESWWQNWYLPETAEQLNALRQILKPKLARYKLSPTDLTAFLDVSYAGPQAFLVQRLLGIKEPATPETLFGSYVHRVLHLAFREYLATSKQPNTKQLKEFAASLFDEETADDRMSDNVLEVVGGFLKARPFTAKSGASEFSFSKHKIMLGHARLSGVIDRYDSGKTSIEIIDYKTGKPASSWQDSGESARQKLHKFQYQLAFYELLFKLSPDFKGVKTISSRIDFVEADKRGNYHSLELEPSSDTHKRIKLLVAVVWKLVQTLELPDISIYPTNFAGMKAFEDDLLK